MSTAGSKLFGNIYQYLLLSLKVRSSDVKDWTPLSVKRAFDWAEYVEKICDDVSRRTWKGSFEQKLMELEKCPLPWACTDLQLSSLKNASTSMLMMLLGNGSLPPSCVEACFKYHKCVATNAVKMISEEVLNKENVSTVIRNQHSRTYKYELSGRFLLNYMERRLKILESASTPEERISRFTKHLLQLFCRHSSASVNILLGSLLSSSISEEDTQDDIRIKQILEHVKTMNFEGSDVNLLVECSLKFYVVWHRWMSWLLSHEAKSADSDQFANKETEAELLRHLIGVFKARDPVFSASIKKLRQRSEVSLAWSKLVMIAEFRQNIQTVS